MIMSTTTRLLLPRNMLLLLLLLLLCMECLICKIAYAEDVIPKHVILNLDLAPSQRWLPALDDLMQTTGGRDSLHAIYADCYQTFKQVGCDDACLSRLTAAFSAKVS